MAGQVPTTEYNILWCVGGGEWQRSVYSIRTIYLTVLEQYGGPDDNR